MKKKLFTHLALMTIIMLIGAGFTSCNKNDDIIPDVNPKQQKENEKEKKGKEQTPEAESNDGIAKVIITFHDGHLHGHFNFHQNSHAKEVKYLAVNQSFVFHHKNHTWVPDESNPKSLNVISGSSNPAYALVINYYDSKGNIINGRFINDDADKRFQHFFVPRNVKKGYGNSTGYTYDGDSTALFRYIYCDTDPWNKSNKYDGAEFVGGTNPIGFKGYFKFDEPRVTFDLVIKLMEARTSKYVNDEPSPYYAPLKEVEEQAKWYDEIQLPVIVYMGNNETLMNFTPALNKKEADYSEKERLVISSLAKAFGISFEEAALDFYFQQNGEAVHNENGFWF